MAPKALIKIVLTGSPSSGKSSTMKELSRIFGSQVVLIPESAVVLLSGGFPAPHHGDIEQIRQFQKAILGVQAGLETICAQQNPAAQIAILDRATLDGAGFWPLGPKSYYENFGIHPETEFSKYDHILFLELPAIEEFGGVNSLRFHDYQQSLASEKQLREVWQNHPSFTVIKAQKTLEEKVQKVVAQIRQLLANS